MSERDFLFQSFVYKKSFSDTSPSIHCNQLSPVALIEVAQFIDFLLTSNDVCHIMPFILLQI